jgi:osmotically-inducible protein OsmY
MGILQLRIKMFRLLQHLILGAAILWGTCVAGHAQDPSVSPDNTGVDKKDRSKDRTTADQQKMNQTDREITRKIRESVVKDKSLSTYAHNVKIITQSGEVTLKGPVRTDPEKAAVEEKAAAVVGTNQIKVAASNP